MEKLLKNQSISQEYKYKQRIQQFINILYIFDRKRRKKRKKSWLDPDQNEWLRNTDFNHHVPLVIRLFFGQFLQTKQFHIIIIAV